MAFVQRNQAGAICGVYRAPQYEADGTTPIAIEEMADDAAEVVAFLSPPDPTLRRLHPYYFRLRFTRDQRIAFATSTDPDVIDLREGFTAASTIGLDDQRTSDGLNLLIAKGIIRSGDKAALLADRREGEKP